MYQARRRSLRTFDLPAGPGPVRARPVLRLARLLAPVLGLAVLIAVLLFGNLVQEVSGGVPVESMAVEDVTLAPGVLEVHVRNDGRVPVTIGQVMVDDAYRPFTVSSGSLGRLASTTVVVPYPWEPAIPVRVALLTSTGTVIEHEIVSPSVTPTGTPATLGRLALIGLAMAMFPVALGLLWLPMLRRASSRVLGAVLAFTLGLLVFLLVDSTAEGLSLAGGLGEGLNGVGVFALGALGALAVFAALESMSETGLAWLIAIGIGLHNLGEGLAVGTAMRAGEVALGTTLVLGFAIHNLTEGVAIAAPLASRNTSYPQRSSYPQPTPFQDQLPPTADRLDLRGAPGVGGGVRMSRRSRSRVGSWRADPLWGLGLLVVVAGVPAVPGLWVGGLAGGGVWAVLGLGVAAGAIAQVAYSVGRVVLRERVGALGAGGFALAVVFMYATGLLA